MSTTPTLTEAIQLAVDSNLRELHTCLPGKIETYNAAKQEANIKPLINRRLRNGEEQELPVLTGVPVIFPQTANALISLPISKGDTVLVLFAERSIDEWLQDGGQVTPANKRRHHISDSVAVPGLYPLTHNSSASASDLLIKMKDSTITLANNGTVKVKGSKIAIGTPAEELVDLLDQLANLLATAVTATSLGPQPLSTATQIAAIQVKLAAMKGAL